MPTPPIGTTTPLSESPFLSRLPLFTLNTEDVNNYPLVAFKPGFPLQAAELNEIQETFSIQQTLTLTMLANWTSSETSEQLTHNVKDICMGPGWNGATPLHPNQIELGPSGIRAVKGWYLITLATSNLKIWVYNNIDFPLNRNGIIFPNYYGFKVRSGFIPCSNTEIDEGWSFNDQSSGAFESSTCGANRFKIEIYESIGTSVLSTLDFVPITHVNSTNMIRYLNNRWISG